jgi:hypothetical protein
MRIRMTLGSRALVNWAADLLMLAGSAGVVVFAWSLLDGAYYQHTQKIQFEIQVAGGDAGQPNRFPSSIPIRFRVIKQRFHFGLCPSLCQRHRNREDGIRCSLPNWTFLPSA